MKCPVCSFVCSDLRDVCPKCALDLRDYKRSMGLPVANETASYDELIGRVRKKAAPTKPAPHDQQAEKSSTGGFFRSLFKRAAPQADSTSTEKVTQVEPSPLPASEKIPSQEFEPTVEEVQHESPEQETISPTLSSTASGPQVIDFSAVEENLESILSELVPSESLEITAVPQEKPVQEPRVEPDFEIIFEDEDSQKGDSAEEVRDELDENVKEGLEAEKDSGDSSHDDHAEQESEPNTVPSIEENPQSIEDAGDGTITHYHEPFIGEENPVFKETHQFVPPAQFSELPWFTKAPPPPEPEIRSDGYEQQKEMPPEDIVPPHQEAEGPIGEIAQPEINAAFSAPENGIASSSDVNEIFSSSYSELRAFTESSMVVELSAEQLTSVKNHQQVLLLFDLARDAIIDPSMESQFTSEVMTSERRHLEASSLDEQLSKVKSIMEAPQLTLKGHRADAPVVTPPLEEIAPPLPPARASAMRRTLAFIGDLLILAILSPIIGGILFFRYGTSISFGQIISAQSFSQQLDVFDAYIFLQYTISSFLVLLVLYPTLSGAFLRATVGMKLMGLSLRRFVPTKHGKVVPNFLQMFVRALCFPFSVLVLGFLPSLWGARTLSDYLAGTELCMKT